MKPRIMKVLDLCTSHVTKDTAEKMNSGGIDWIHDVTTYGWWVWCDTDPIEERNELPEELRRCIDFAKNLGCDWLHFDCDADVVEGLPTFDW